MAARDWAGKFNKYRHYLDTEKIIPLPQAAALAATHMPRLRKFNLSLGTLDCCTYLAKGEEDFFDLVQGWGPKNDMDPRDMGFMEDDKLKALEMRGKRRLYLQTRSWRGDEDKKGMEEVLELFRNAGDREEN